MKFSMALLALTVVSSAYAKPVYNVKRKAASAIKCALDPSLGTGIDPDYVNKQVKAVSTCYEAVHIVQSCGAGSSMDSIMTSAAVEVCDKETGKLSKPDEALKKLMIERCGKVCDPRSDGTLCLSQQAFCRLDVSKFLNMVNSKMN